MPQAVRPSVKVPAMASVTSFFMVVSLSVVRAVWSPLSQDTNDTTSHVRWGGLPVDAQLNCQERFDRPNQKPSTATSRCVAPDASAAPIAM